MILFDPGKARMHAGQRAGKARNVIWDDRQAKIGKAGRFAVGIYDHGTDLRLQPLDDAGKDRPPPE